MKFGLYSVSIWVNMQKNFKLLGQTVSEKSAMLFSRYHRIFFENCETEEQKNLVCIEDLYGLIYKKNFKFLGHTVSEKSAMLISSYHRIFLENCVTKKHEIWFA